MATQNTAIKSMNLIKQKASSVYQDAIPDATAENVHFIRDILFSDNYQPQLNEFVNSLINMIGLTIVRNKSYNNPLATFKKGSVPLGTDIQDVYTNPAEKETYEFTNAAMAGLLTINDPDTKVAYYRLNRKDKYTKTISREGLRNAFNNWESFNDYVGSITNSLYSGNYIDEFEYTKDLIDGAYDNNKVITEVINDVVDEETATAFVKKCRSLYKKITFPSTEYNAYSKFRDTDTPVKTWTDADRICLIVKSDIMAEVDVDVLARAFNIDNANFLGRVIEVDGFKNENILGVLFDEAWLQIYENLFRFDEFYNGNVMAWNQYLHVWQTYAICPFANAVMLVTQEPVPATAISLNASSYAVDKDATASVTLTKTPSNATTEIEYQSSDDSIFTVVRNSDLSATITGKAVGTAKLYAFSDNGLEVSADVTISE